MRVATGLPGPLQEVAPAVARASELGYDVLTAEETAYDPLLRLGVAALEPSSALLSTSVALAFPRSPWVLAQQAWEIQRASGGRLVLGLGTQVKGHLERRFSVPWAPPGPRLRDYVQCLRAIWSTWQHGEPPEYEGTYYRFLLMNPGSDPGPIDHPDIPVLLAAVNPYNAGLAGEVGDGIALHAFVTERYAREVLLPAARDGARRAGRDPQSVYVRGGGFIATGRTAGEVEQAREQARRRVAYYGSTRSYSAVLRLHGWDDEAAALHRLSIEGRWDEMTRLITDDILDAFITTGTWEELPPLLQGRYGGLADEVSVAARALDPDEVDGLVETIQRIQAIPPRGSASSIN